MAVVIRLTRCGMKNTPLYRVVAADKSYPRDGRCLEILGSYDPKKKEKKVNVKKDRLEHWLKNGALMSPTVSKLVVKI